MEALSGESNFACPVCSATMMPGTTYAEHRAVKTRGLGRVWELEDGAPRLVECSRCQGTGVLENRRVRVDRRQRPDRRS